MFSECHRECMKDLNSWVEPPGPVFISTLRLIEFLDLLLKYIENVARRAAVLEPGSEWVITEILFCASFVHSQGIIEYKLEVGGCSRNRAGMRHKRGDGGVEGRIVGS
jgi:hypothetical protein